MLPFPNDQLHPNEILDATYAAADAILEVYHQREDIVAEIKSDNSPVTQADIRAHHIIQAVLEKSGWPVMSEEGQQASYDERKEWEYYWVVDPLDGTKEFIKGNGEFTINIALVKGNSPVFGVVYSPILNWLYVGGPGMPSYKSLQRVTWDELLVQGMRLPGRLPEKITIVASRSHGSPETEALIAHWEAQHGSIDRVSMGSSLKICLVAEGRAHAYPRVALTMEWDTAAGHAVALGAQCSMFQIEVIDGMPTWSKPVIYNKENLLNPYFLVCGAPYLCGNA
ncbi:MAG: 3'(2'),5'-bisphosphate nucleotidase CysQ [Schleiferiaceae bacterium]|nr:3'(2'),5'-bisphosphate nucleotidase CysQ [Schleiferiaceae bacterium]